MNCEIIAVGTELLLGEIVNTNAQMLSLGLSELGINVYYHTVCGDNPSRLRDAMEIAKNRADIIITTGGLGPTADDLTKETIAAVFGKKLYMDPVEQARLHVRMGENRTPNNEKQAMLPEGSVALVNDWGTAPGCAFEVDGTHVLMLPGPPRECTPMFRERALPYLQKLTGGVISSSYIKVFGLGESAMEDRLAPYIDTLIDVTAAPYAKEGECEVRVTARGDSRDEALTRCLPVIDHIKGMLGDVVYGVDVSSLEEVVVNGLLSLGLTIAAAESCSGGMLAKRITDIPGASKCFGTGFVTYSNEAKERLLGVSAETLAQHGAVSEAVALEMARGARARSGADIGVGITGIAGPGGGSEEKPVGTVFVAIAHAGGEVVTSPNRRYLRDRSRIRSQSASLALDLVRREILMGDAQ